MIHFKFRESFAMVLRFVMKFLLVGISQLGIHGISVKPSGF